MVSATELNCHTEYVYRLQLENHILMCWLPSHICTGEHMQMNC
jgi:hypothetical protein